MSEQFRCRDCSYICARDEMESDYIAPEDADSDEFWTMWICPRCRQWPPTLDDGWIKLATAPVGKIDLSN